MARAWNCTTISKFVLIWAMHQLLITHEFFSWIFLKKDLGCAQSYVLIGPYRVYLLWRGDYKIKLLSHQLFLHELTITKNGAFSMLFMFSTKALHLMEIKRIMGVIRLSSDNVIFLIHFDFHLPYLCNCVLYKKA